MRLLGTAAELRAAVGAARLALVPTLGGLHDGHLSLVRHARTLADMVVVSIYVNPLQFGEGEDFADYPRRLSADCEKLRGLADIVYAPDDAEMYAEEQTVKIALPPLADELCGAVRPGFFQGVAIVVCKLFNQTRPHVAIFGRKDYQQACLVRQLTRQLAFPLEIALHPTVREADGLAMSSRNIYLTADERQRAPLLYATLQRTAAAISAGADEQTACAAAFAAVEEVGMSCDYFTLRAADSLLPHNRNEEGVLLAAAQLGRARLIDNIEIPPVGDAAAD